MAISLQDYRSAAGLDKWITELGVTPAPVPRQGIHEALRFFALHMAQLPAAMALNFLRATDLSKPVRIVSLHPGETLIAYRTGNESQFKLFFSRVGNTVMSSGLNPQDRSFVRFSVRSSVQALESTAAPAIDTWTRLGPGQRTTVAPRANSSGYMAPGGAIQLIVPDSHSHLLVAQV